MECFGEGWQADQGVKHLKYEVRDDLISAVNNEIILSFKRNNNPPHNQKVTSMNITWRCMGTMYKAKSGQTTRRWRCCLTRSPNIKCVNGVSSGVGLWIYVLQFGLLKAPIARLWIHSCVCGCMNYIIAVRGGRLGLGWNALWMVVRTNNNNNANNKPFWEILSVDKCWGLCASHMIVKKLFNFSMIVFRAVAVGFACCCCWCLSGETGSREICSLTTMGCNKK